MKHRQTVQTHIPIFILCEALPFSRKRNEPPCPRSYVDGMSWALSGQHAVLAAADTCYFWGNVAVCVFHRLKTCDHGTKYKVFSPNRHESVALAHQSNMLIFPLNFTLWAHKDKSAHQTRSSCSEFPYGGNNKAWNKLNCSYRVALITQIMSRPCPMISVANVINKIFKRGHACTGVIWYLASAAQWDTEFFVLSYKLFFIK